MDIPGPPAPRAKALIIGGRTALEGKRFDEAASALNAAANEAAVTGAAGLSTAELAELFLFLGMALQKADWKDPPEPYQEITPPAAKQAYLRAVTLAPDKNLLPREFPPLAIASWKLALAEVSKRGRTNLVVRAPGTALVSIDGGPPKSGMIPNLDLVQGDHWVRVEDPGRRPYGTMVSLGTPSHEIEVPVQAALALPDAAAAAHARRQGAAYALVAEVRPGPPALLEMRLINAVTGARRDGTVITAGDGTALEAAVMRLEELARKERFDESGQVVAPSQSGLRDLGLGPVPPRPPSNEVRLSDAPGAWVKSRWPVLAAVGVAVGTALLLGVLVAHDDGR